MQDIITQVKELYEKLTIRSKKYNVQFEELANKRIKVDADAKANDDLTKELEAREKSVKEVEDLVKLQSDVAEGNKNLTSNKKALKKKEAEFEEKKSKELKEIEGQKEEVAAGRSKLKKMEQDLEKKKEDYKNKVMTEINKSLKDKGIEL